MSKEHTDVMATKLTENNIYDYVDFDLFSRINPYIYSAIVKFIKEYMQVINNKASEEKVPAEQVLNALLTEIKKIEFERPYAERKFKMEKDGFEIDQSDFKKFIGEKIPVLVKVEEFINNIDIPKPKNELLESLLKKIEEIQAIINRYKKDNKKNILNDFNTNVNAVINELKENKINELSGQSKVYKILQDLHSAENDYYHGLWFAKFRQGHSSLGPHIIEARNIFNDFKLAQQEPAPISTNVLR